jgi:hypothetical protein
MNQLAKELDEKLRTLDPDSARNLESLVRDAIARFEKNGTSGDPSVERKQAINRLIGIWRSDSPPTDQEVEQIVDDERMKKYG